MSEFDHPFLPHFHKWSGDFEERVLKFIAAELGTVISQNNDIHQHLIEFFTAAGLRLAAIESAIKAGYKPSAEEVIALNEVLQLSAALKAKTGAMSTTPPALNQHAETKT